MHKIYGESISIRNIPTHTPIAADVLTVLISLETGSFIPGHVILDKYSFNFLLTEFINVVLINAFINLTMSLPKLVMNKSVSLFIVSSKSSSKSSPSIASNII